MCKRSGDGSASVTVRGLVAQLCILAPAVGESGQGKHLRAHGGRRCCAAVAACNVWEGALHAASATRGNTQRAAVSSGGGGGGSGSSGSGGSAGVPWRRSSVQRRRAA
eukprot:TRINITY_DN835_c1_g2_i1.p2 TRINITY_DN835_c1_g2~~TRINITY_DN835_c1_g2_i1.p2  ORF type:complete len:108 (-),score=30.27 TRINITY_DN835_c1_g2_i1:57-380(-)